MCIVFDIICDRDNSNWSRICPGYLFVFQSMGRLSVDTFLFFHDTRWNATDLHCIKYLAIVVCCLLQLLYKHNIHEKNAYTPTRDMVSHLQTLARETCEHVVWDMQGV